MIINPELRRNLWIELTPQRLIVTPIVIAAILYLSYLTTSETSNPLITVKNTAFAIFLFYLFLWGTKAASESVPDEINNHTWDIQRLSVIKPSTLAWGKLFGSTVYAWYGALLALIPYLFISWQTQSTRPFAVELGVYLLGGIFAHSFALLSSMSASPQDKNSKVRTYPYLLIGLYIAWVFTGPVLTALRGSSFMMPQSISEAVTWYQFTFTSFSFHFTVLCLFLGWTLIGLVRSMRQALQYHSQPWAWLAFTLFCMIYFAGRLYQPSDNIQWKDWEILRQSPHYIAFFIASFLTYISVFSEKINTVTYKKLAIKQQLPRWSASFVLAVLMGIWICFMPSINHFTPAIFSGAAVFLMTRDILIVHYFQFSDNPKRALLTAAFYIAVLYLLIPNLCVALDANALVPLFWPDGGVMDYKAISLIGPALEVLVMGWLVWRRFVGLQENRIR